LTSIWERLDQVASTARTALTAQRIATVAVGVADADGLDAITMRRLATELGVAPMAAYRHVAGKDDVLELMVDLIYGEVELPEDADWPATMRALARDLRAMVLRHPWLTQVTVPELTPNRMALAERALAVLRSADLDADTSMSIFRTVVAYVHGAASTEIGLRRLMEDRGWIDGTETRTGLAAQMAWLLNTGRYPSFERYVREGTRKDDLQWQFETGLDAILDGIATRIT
jgi:AcrR family transcriptional regulator